MSKSAKPSARLMVNWNGLRRARPDPMFIGSIAATIVSLTLTACGPQGDGAVQRVTLDELPRGPSEPLPSPDIAGATWAAAEGRASVGFGKPGAAPFLTLDCTDGGLVRIIRHAAADPGAKAMLAVIGNGLISRLPIDAAEFQGGWRWEAALPAADPGLDAFDSGGTVEATLPGAGMLTMADSELPGQFLSDCRQASTAHSLPE